MKKNRNNKFHFSTGSVHTILPRQKKQTEIPHTRYPHPVHKKDASNMTKNFFLDNRCKMKKDRVLEYSMSLPFYLFSYI